jgi:integrase
MAKHTIEILTAAEVRAASPGEKMYRLRDGGNLFLQIETTGRKWWAFRYTFAGRQKSLSLGVYPDTTLAKARKAAKTAREQLAEGIDPTEVRKTKDTEVETLAEVVQEWLEKFSPGWAEKYAAIVASSLRRDLLPHMGGRPMIEVSAPQLLTVLRRVEASGRLDSAHKLRSVCGQVWRYGVATGRAERDIAHDLRGALAPLQRRSMSTVLDPEKVGALLRDLDSYQGDFATRCFLQLAPLCLLRPSELRRTKWAEVSLDGAEIRLPFERMKLRKAVKTARQGEVAHIVPLSRQSVAILRRLFEVTGCHDLVFASPHLGHKRPIAPQTPISALRRLGYAGTEQTVHGFRAMASTLLHELGFNSDLIEKQLAHADRNQIRAKYNHADFLDQRRQMLQAWADYLDQLRAGKADKIIPIRRAVSE